MCRESAAVVRGALRDRDCCRQAVAERRGCLGLGIMAEARAAHVFDEKGGERPKRGSIGAVARDDEGDPAIKALVSDRDVSSGSHRSLPRLPQQCSGLFRSQGSEDEIYGLWRCRVGSVSSVLLSAGDSPVRAAPTICDRVSSWLLERRAKTRGAFFIIVGYIVVRATLTDLWYVFADSEKPGDNLFTIVAGIAGAQVFVVVMFLSSEGVCRASRAILDYHYIWRWCVVSMAFFVSFGLFELSSRYGLIWLNRRTPGLLDSMRVPIAVLVSLFMFKRWFGKLEWLAVGMMSFAMASLTFLRFQCMDSPLGCHELSMQSQWANPSGITYGIAALVIETFACALAERIFKGKSHGLVRSHYVAERPKFYVCVFHFLFWFLAICFGIASLASYTDILPDNLSWNCITTYAPEHWSFNYCVLVGAIGAHALLTSLVLRQFSTVTLAVLELLCFCFTCSFSDAFRRELHYSARAMQSFMIVIIIVLAAILFQTGRINLHKLREALHVEKHAVERAGWAQSLMGLMSAPHRPFDVSLANEAQEGFCSVLWRHMPVVMYVLSQAFRENLDQKAMHSGIIVPALIPLVNGVCFLILSNTLTYCSHGVAGLRQAWKPLKVVKYMLIAFLFATSRFLNTLAFAFGTSAATKDAASKIYIPVSALLSSCILNKYFMWLEWLALAILTLAAATYAMVDSVGEEGRQGVGGGSALGLLCATAAGVVGAVNSLIMEKFMKGEADPYAVQKVRTDFGIVVFSAMFLFVHGYIGEIRQQPSLAFWLPRPLTSECVLDGSCNGTGSYVPSDPLEYEGGCVCGSGFFVGWNTQWVVYTCVLSSVCFSHFTGLVVKQFSSVMRAIADGLNLVVIYFLLTPLLNNTGFPPGNLADDFMILIIPLSGMAFSVSAAEMQKVVFAAQQQRYGEIPNREVECNSDDERVSDDASSEDGCDSESDRS